MRKSLLMCVRTRWLAAICCVQLCIGLALATPVRAAEPPAISAKAWILMDAQTGQVISKKNETTKLPMASTTKIMTTLLTIESGNLDDPFVVDADAIRVEGSSMGLQVGDVVTKRALCVGMLLPSGNDAANAAAVAVAGSIPAFLERMNARAAEIGMTRTCFASPSGLDANGHGASAHDMARLARVALQNETFAAICKEPAETVSFGNPPYSRTLYNTNRLLTMADGIIGVKTGFTDAAGRCLVSACTKDASTLICVTLHDKQDWADHLALYAFGFSDTKAYAVPLPQSLSIPVEGGVASAVRVYAKEPLSITAWQGVPADCKEQVLLPPFATAPLAKGDCLGALVYTANGCTVATLPLYAAEAITDANVADANVADAASNPSDAQSNLLTRFLNWLYAVS